MAEYVTGAGQTLHKVHEAADCSGACPIHEPSDHPMKDWPTAWIDGRFWRTCEHGFHHPDPDSVKPLPPFDVFLYREAVCSVALSHEEDCGCRTCIAAADGVGSDDALMEIIAEAHEGHSRVPCDGCCQP